jgi:diaminopimelate decarboxylase
MTAAALPFHYRDRVLYCEGVELAEIADRAGTPCYVYSATGITDRFREYDDALAGIPHRICYAVKANSNLSVLRRLAEAGAGFDIVSGGELYRVRQAGGDAAKIVFAGVGKTRTEIEYALDEGIFSFNCESEAEMALIDSLCHRMGKTASVAVRVNPDVDAATHPYISTGLREHKFGIDIAAVEGVYQRAASLGHLRLEGVACHIGSQLLDASPLLDAAGKMLELVKRLRQQGIAIRHLDLGGGWGVPYKPGESAGNLSAFLAGIRGMLEGHDLTLLFEPGRSIVAESGVLLARVLYRKSTERKEFIVVDAAMNDLIRPALYNAHHEIIPLRQTDRGSMLADVVGPICETGDFLARDRQMPNLLPGDLVAVLTAGAYGSVSASNYNSRPRPAEVMVEGKAWRVVRSRESLADLIRGEE